MRLPVARFDPIANTDRPNWLSTGVIRLLVLCAFIVLVEMLRPRLSPHSAGLIAIAGAAAVLVGAALFVGVQRSPPGAAGAPPGFRVSPRRTCPA